MTRCTRDLGLVKGSERRARGGLFQLEVSEDSGIPRTRKHKCGAVVFPPLVLNTPSCISLVWDSRSLAQFTSCSPSVPGTPENYRVTSILNWLLLLGNTARNRERQQRVPRKAENPGSLSAQWSFDAMTLARLPHLCSIPHPLPQFEDRLLATKRHTGEPRLRVPKALRALLAVTARQHFPKSSTLLLAYAEAPLVSLSSLLGGRRILGARVWVFVEGAWETKLTHCSLLP